MLICINCGAKNDDEAKFCEACGTRLAESGNTQNSMAKKPAQEEAPVAQNDAAVQQEPVAQTENVESSVPKQGQNPVVEEVNPEPAVEFVTTPAEKNKKFTIIAAVVAVLVIGALCWNTVLAAIAPKLYAQSVVMKTIDQVSDEMMKSEKNILGFNVEKEKEITSSIEAVLNEVGGTDLDGIGFRLTAKNSEKKKKLMFSAEALYDGDTLASGVAMLDNKNIYVDSPELFKTSLSVPSKKFGKAWNDSELAKESDIEISEDTDLSYSNLFKEKDLLTKKSNKSIKKEVKNLIKAATIEKSKGTADVGGKSVNTKTITIAVDPDDLEDTLKNIVEIVEDDENIIDAFEASDELEDSKDEFFDAMNEGIDAMCGSIDGDVILELQVYKGKAVVIATEIEIDGGVDIRIETAFEDKNIFINDVKMVMEVKAQDSKMVVEIDSEGNHIAKGKVFTDETVVKVKADKEEMAKIEHNMTLDMKKNEYEQKISIIADGEEAGITLGGTCSNKKEFKLSIDKIKFKGVEMEDIPKIKGKLAVTITPKAKFDKVNTSDSLNLLASDEDDIEKWAEGVEEKAESFVEKNEEFFESKVAKLFGLMQNSYDDYYYN